MRTRVNTEETSEFPSSRECSQTLDLCRLWRSRCRVSTHHEASLVAPHVGSPVETLTRDGDPLVRYYDRHHHPSQWVSQLGGPRPQCGLRTRTTSVMPDLALLDQFLRGCAGVCLGMWLLASGKLWGGAATNVLSSMPSSSMPHPRMPANQQPQPRTPHPVDDPPSSASILDRGLHLRERRDQTL